MDYQYQLTIWDEKRHINAIYTGSEINANDFQPITFTSQNLDAESFEGFITSCLETLVLLFTGQDPAMLYRAAVEECQHENSDDCDCPPLSIPIPSILAYHGVALSQEIGEVDMNFEEWVTRDKRVRVRRYRLPNGQVETIQRTNEAGPPEGWGDYDYWRNRALNEKLNRWFEQGINLYNAWAATTRLSSIAASEEGKQELSDD